MKSSKMLEGIARNMSVRDGNKTVKECCVDITARERSEDIHFHITYFTSEREGMRNLAQGMFDVALLAGRNVKVNFVTIELFDTIVSGNIMYRKSIENVRDELEEFRRTLASRFNSDFRIGAVAEGRRVVFLALFALLCELEPLGGNKMITEAHHFDLETLKGFLDSVNKRLMRENLAKGVLDYKLHVGEIDDYEIEDINVQKDEVVVWLERKSLKVKT